MPGSRRRTLYLHVGMPRTGSTTIRRALGEFEPQLRERGILIPLAGRFTASTAYNHTHSHSKLVTVLSGQWYLEYAAPDVWETLAREIAASSACAVVMSGSMFTAYPMYSSTPGALAARYVESLARGCDLDVRIIAYVRPQAELVESYYVPRPLRGFSVPFSEFAHDALSGDKLDFNCIFEPWRERFGDRVHISTFREAVRSGGPDTHFFAHIGCPDLIRRRTRRFNSRGGARAMEMQRLVAAALIEAGLDFPTRATTILKLGPIRSPRDDDTLFAPLTREEMDSVMGRFSRRNVRFTRQYGIDPSALAYEERADVEVRRPSVCGPDDLDEAEHAQVRAYVQTALAEAAACGVDRAQVRPSGS